jgi:hypothetical protein
MLISVGSNNVPFIRCECKSCEEGDVSEEKGWVGAGEDALLFGVLARKFTSLRRSKGETDAIVRNF